MDARSTQRLHTGHEIPVIGLGTWKLSEDTAGVVMTAIDVGYAMIDTSGDYDTQPGIARALKNAVVPRSDLYIVTKIEETDDAYEAVKQNLAELQCDYADPILIHRPPEDGAGEELWRGLIRAKEEGLTRDIGVSNYPAEKIDRLIEATGEKPVVNQIEWSPFGHSDDMLAYAREHDMIIQAYSPMTRGERLDNETLNEIAGAHNKSPAQVLIRWNLQRGTIPIPKAQKQVHLRENINVFDFELDEKEMERLNNLNERYSALGELPYA